ncbi:MAG TPA: S8 family serine peptidase [Acidimicrobiia bacterium]|nr:S8 family serine peptidase [Acidimicrobiia bacterium]
MLARKLWLPFVCLVVILASVPAAGAAPALERVIITLQPGGENPENVAQVLANEHGGEIGFVYRHALRGFSMEIPAQAVAALARNPKVLAIEPDREVAAVGTQPIPTGVDRVDADLNPGAASFPSVDIAIIDTGVYIGQTSSGQSRSHLDLNLVYVTDCTSAIFYPTFGGCSGSGNFQDENGHGTHVAGIAAAKDNDIGSIGTAPGAVIWSVKVLNADGTGYLGSILAGIDFVTSQASAIEVANMSLGFEGVSDALATALTNSTNAGVVYVTAAGNSAKDAATFSPANHPDVITVSAMADFDGKPGALGGATCRSDGDDTLADFSNHGSLVEIAAPGVCIYSTWLADGYATVSGTSMAAPAVAGAVARYIAQSGHATNNRTDVLAIREAVVGAGAPQASACGFSGDPDSSREPMLFLNATLFGGSGECDDGTPAPNVAPVAGFTSSCSGLTCSFTNTSTDANGDALSFVWEFGDGAGSTEPNPVHTYSVPGPYSVSLTASDASESDVETLDITVSETLPNQPPLSDFDYACSNLTCSFTNLSSDPDGDALSHSWDFGDGSTSTQVSPSHSYGAAGAYTVTLTSSDGSLSETASQSITVVAPALTMTAAVYPILLDGRKASITVDVFDGSGVGVPGATVAGVWSYLDRRGRSLTATQSGVTNSSGRVTLNKTFSPGTTVQSYCVTSVTKSGWTYVPSPITCGYPLTSGVAAIRPGPR